MEVDILLYKLFNLGEWRVSYDLIKSHMTLHHNELQSHYELQS